METFCQLDATDGSEVADYCNSSDDRVTTCAALCQAEPSLFRVGARGPVLALESINAATCRLIEAAIQ